MVTDDIFICIITTNGAAYNWTVVNMNVSDDHTISQF